LGRKVSKLYNKVINCDKVIFMKIMIIGAGASGVSAAINIKRKYPHDEVTIIEHSDKALKKILATGNGRCNLGNKQLLLSFYNHPELLDKYSFKEYVSYIESFGFKTKLIGDLLYPYSESAQTVRNQMLKLAEKLSIKINLNEDFIDYEVKDEFIIVKTSLRTYQVDKLIIATGAKSTKGLGNDGSIYSILAKHGYAITPLHPGLVPIKTKENTKLLDGQRLKAKVSLLENGKTIFVEEGEILFKKDGLSGIVIMNLSNHINNNQNEYKIVINSLGENIQELQENHQQILDKREFLSQYFSPKFVEYFVSHLNELDLIKALQNWTFTFKDFYDYENSQITVGGIDLSNIKDHFESKFEKNVYFLGEVLDMHGPCGGYNLTWAFMSSLLLMQ